MCSFDTGCPGTGIMSTPMDTNIIPTSSSTHDLSFTNRKQSHVFFTTKSTKLNLKEIADNEIQIIQFCTTVLLVFHFKLLCIRIYQKTISRMCSWLPWIRLRNSLSIPKLWIFLSE
uniref:Uncharacterized protein LOC111105237 isoform X3 n=1 Tax=Crassostrea virginica TaxID=6565 RepID=A0A8B8AWM4_CRAVI|nr:uncharacterized protein LOC111105237 isoform X3 [Crassostrea virginica]